MYMHASVSVCLLGEAACMSLFHVAGYCLARILTHLIPTTHIRG